MEEDIGRKLFWRRHGLLGTCYDMDFSFGYLCKPLQQCLWGRSKKRHRPIVLLEMLPIVRSENGNFHGCSF